jgi:O-antigen ligase
LFGIASFLLHPSKTLWRESAYPNSLTSTFLGRNTAAIYFGSCGIIWLLFLIESGRRRFPQEPMSWRETLDQIISEKPGDSLVPAAMLLVCLLAMFMTTSRAGVVFSLSAMILATAVYLRTALRYRGMLIAVAMGAAVAFILLQVGGGGLEGRFESQGLESGGRFDVYRSTLRMIADHPWLGTGLGTFAWVFPAYRSANVSMWGVWDRAHNPLLELAAELGLPMAALIVVGWLVVLAVLIHGARTRRRDVVVPVAALSIALLALVHSAIDFPLQIPGYAIVMFALTGAGLAQSFRSASN